MRVIWVAGRTRRPIIGSLQKSRENPGARLLIPVISILVTILKSVLQYKKRLNLNQA